MMHCGYFDTARKNNHSATLTSTVVGGQRPFRLKFAPKVIHPFADFGNFRLERLDHRRQRKKFKYDEQEVAHGLSNEL